jgi:predicted nucleic acid-binding Zn ribbon protein
VDDFDRVMKGNVTGWTAYIALQRVLMRWHEISGNEYAEWLASCLMTDPALMEDWALSLEEAIDERGDNNTTQPYGTQRPLPEDFVKKCRERRKKMLEQNK